MAARDPFANTCSTCGMYGGGHIMGCPEILPHLVLCEYAGCPNKFESGTTDCLADCHCSQHCKTEAHVRYCKGRAS